MIKIKTDKKHPDLKFWQFLKEILERLDVARMSSKDGTVRTHGGITQPVYVVKLCAWRASAITDYLQHVDQAVARKVNACVRLRGTDYGGSPPPIGLPENFYDSGWLAERTALNAEFEDELEMSKEVFEFLVVATGSL
jgi:hypothetical protein